MYSTLEKNYIHALPIFIDILHGMQPIRNKQTFEINELEIKSILQEIVHQIPLHQVVVVVSRYIINTWWPL